MKKILLTLIAIMLTFTFITNPADAKKKSKTIIAFRGDKITLPKGNWKIVDDGLNPEAKKQYGYEQAKIKNGNILIINNEKTAFKGEVKSDTGCKLTLSAKINGKKQKIIVKVVGFYESAFYGTYVEEDTDTSTHDKSRYSYQLKLANNAMKLTDFKFSFKDKNATKYMKVNKTGKITVTQHLVWKEVNGITQGIDTDLCPLPYKTYVIATCKKGKFKGKKIKFEVILQY